MERNDIIKVLEWLEWLKSNTRYSGEAEIELTISLIKALTEENESLKQAMEHEHASFMETFGEYAEKCDKLTEENERLRGCVMSEEQVRNIANETIQQGIFIIKADTVRKMQSEIEARCLKGGIYPAFVKSTIDQIAKEMIEGETK